MNQEHINISHMQCWLFRLAQSKWHQTPMETISLFKQFAIFGYIAGCYDILHLSSYRHALTEIEAILTQNKCISATEPAPTATNEIKEACAIETMHYMLQRYARENRIPFEDAFYLFASSTTYEILFDFESAVWKEGPDYLQSLFEKDLAKQAV